MRRRDFLALICGSVAARPASAQAAKNQYWIAIADPGFTATGWRNLPLYRPLFPELRRLGDVEGQNLSVAYFAAEGHVERYADVARRVVERDPDVIVCLTGDLVPALMKQTRTIPIVAFMANPVFVGSVKNLARPGGNLTGVSIDAGIEIEGKRLELLKEAVPSVSRVAVLNTRAEPFYATWQPKLREYAGKLGMALFEVLLRDPSPPEIKRGFAELARNRPDALLLGPEPAFGAHARLITELAAQNRLPAIYPYPAYAEHDALMTYTFDPTNWRGRWRTTCTGFCTAPGPATSRSISRPASSSRST